MTNQLISFFKKVQVQLRRDKAAKRFVETWTNRGNEKSDAQMFWRDLLSDVLGMTKNFASRVCYEKTVIVDGQTKFIDIYIPETLVLIEQKSLGKSLSKELTQSGGTELTPYQQAKRYSDYLPRDEKPKWIIVSNFSEIRIYNMNARQPEKEFESIALKDLPKECHRLKFLVDTTEEYVSHEVSLSMEAGSIIGKIYDKLLEQYADKTNPESLKSLNKLCVRLVFCMYAEDSGLFGHHMMFHDYMKQYASKDWRNALINLFKILDTKQEARDPYLEEDLAQFPYVNGGLFADETIEIPRFTDELKKQILEDGCGFDWSEISPTIFGAVFESTLNPETRRNGGMHYTSIENIHKVIDPLFLNDLKQELETVKKNIQSAPAKNRSYELQKFQNKLANLKFLDPAAGSGNFLTEAFMSLRKLENEAIKTLYGTQITAAGLLNPIEVSIHQFYGIEINDFAVTVAKTALWIAEHQMMKQTESIVNMPMDFLPLKTYANIVEGNALQMDWARISAKQDEVGIRTKKLKVQTVSQEEFDRLEATHPNTLFDPRKHYDTLSIITPEVEISTEKQESEIEPVTYDYIIGNPPFVGRRYRSKQQIEDIANFFPKSKDVDYVACWYKKAAQLIQNTKTKIAFVATNSITQGEQVSMLWKLLFNDFNIQIDFAYRTFRWDSESSSKAHVHCVIIGFSNNTCHVEGGKMRHGEERSDVAISPKKYIYDGDQRIEAKNISPYLIDADNVFIESRNKPLCNVPKMSNGNVPLDGDHLKIEESEFEQFKDCVYLKRLIGGDELINNKKRYVLWLVNASPSELRKMPLVMKRVEACRQARLNMKDKASQKLAETPTTFRDVQNPDIFIAIPLVSSEKRKYIPMAYFDGSTIPTNQVQIIPSATLFHFGVLTSSVHMAWMRAVCGRLEMRYRYSKDVVYNNFPWPTLADSQRQKIEQTAQAILDARALYPESSLADLYDETVMPKELRRAHQENDKTVLQAYGFSPQMPESEIVKKLLEMYQKLVE